MVITPGIPNLPFRIINGTKWFDLIAEPVKAEILPNLFSEIIVIFSLEVGVAVLAEAALSFLGVGIQPPTSSWGLMIAEGKVSVFLRPWLVILPGMFIFLLVLAANLVGDGLRDLMSNESRR